MYGSIVDSNAPTSVQKYYLNQMPEFVFEAPHPLNAGIKRGALFQLVYYIVSLGAAGYYIYYHTPYVQTVTTQLSVIDGKHEYQVFLIALGMACLILLYRLLSVAKRAFINKKLWYIGLPTQLIVTDQKKADYIDWNHIQPNPEYVSDFTTGKLTMKLYPGYSAQVVANPIVNSNTITIAHVPNLEIKRLIENHLKSTSSI